MNLDQAIQVFHEESRDLLVDMEHLLLKIEAGQTDRELKNALFRCVHTIKGSAGMFGLEHVVDFTHVVESVLDRLRTGAIECSAALAEILLKSRDHIAALIEANADSPNLSSSTAEQALLRSLAEYQESASPVAEHRWHISLRFAPDVMQHGMDPLGFIRCLGELGEMASIAVLVEDLPELDKMDPESCYLGFEIDLIANTSKAKIQEIFSFVQDLCNVRVLPPRSSVEDYLRLIRELPEDPHRLGEILTASGAVTPAELDAALRLQEEKEGPDHKPIGELLIAQGVVHEETVDAAVAKQQENRDRHGARTTQYLRVQADKLDRLINLVGEMVISSASVGLHTARGGDPLTREAAAAMSLLVEDIRDSALQLRMVPIGETFQRFQRVVRDASAELGKEITLSISGADTELDKTVVEKISDPLTHLIRNACDHGIEPRSVRQKSGKPSAGTIYLNACHESGAIIIEVRDDGGGLDLGRIVAKAAERGLIAPDENLTDQEVFSLIFEPGFSTADTVTNLSGRGVGMDVVRRNIESLRGSVDVGSTAGEGTTFRIRLPLTLAIIDGFLSTVGDATYVVPLEMVEECVELTSAGFHDGDDKNLLNLRGEVLPIVSLREHFNSDGVKPRRQNVLVVSYAGVKAGLVVDDLLGEHQTVIKPLGEIFAAVPGLSGSTILGSGKVALILDVPGLIQFALERDNEVVNRQTSAKAVRQSKMH